MKKEFPQLFWGLVVLAVTMLFAAMFTVGAIRDARRAGDEITVTGSAKRSVSSDTAALTVSVSDTQATSQSAYTNVLKYTQAVNAFLKSNQVPVAEVTWQPIQTYQSSVTETQADGSRTERPTFNLKRTFIIRSSNVDRIVTLSEQLGNLIEQGVQLQVEPIQYLYTHLADIRNQLLEEATRNALSRAKVMAEASNAKVGSLRSARMGVFQITPRNSVQVDDYGSFDTSNREKDVTAVVGVSFALQTR